MQDGKENKQNRHSKRMRQKGTQDIRLYLETKLRKELKIRELLMLQFENLSPFRKDSSPNSK